MAELERIFYSSGKNKLPVISSVPFSTFLNSFQMKHTKEPSTQTQPFMVVKFITHPILSDHTRVPYLLKTYTFKNIQFLKNV